MARTSYTCFDGDRDIHYYRLMQAWHANDRFNFTFINAHDITQARDSSTEETIKRSLRTRLNASDVFIVLIGESTKNLYRFVRWEIEMALKKGMPIVVEVPEALIRPFRTIWSTNSCKYKTGGIFTFN